jgi:AcrR family transcriptional regulator
VTASRSQDPRVARNRAAVRAAALAVLAGEGMRALTVERLAEASGVSRSTIYRHWPDLPALVLEAFDEAVHAGRVETATTGDFAADLLTYLRDYARRLNDPGYAGVIIAIIEWSWRDPAFAAAHARSFDDTRSRAAGILRRGRAASQVRGDVDVRAGVEDMVAPFLYRRLVLRHTITRRDVERLHRRLVENLTPPALSALSAVRALSSSREG